MSSPTKDFDRFYNASVSAFAAQPKNKGIPIRKLFDTNRANFEKMTESVCQLREHYNDESDRSETSLYSYCILDSIREHMMFIIAITSR